MFSDKQDILVDKQTDLIYINIKIPKIHFETFRNIDTIFMT